MEWLIHTQYYSNHLLPCLCCPNCEGDQSGALQKIPQLNYTMEYVTTHLQEISQRIR